MYHRVGSPRRRHSDQGHLVSRGDQVAYKRTRDEGCQTCPAEHQPEASNAHSGLDRQHLRSGLCQQTGGDQVTVTVERDYPVVPAAGGIGDCVESSSYSGPPQRDRGHVVQGRAGSSNRMVPESESGQCSVPGVGDSTSGSVRHEVQLQVPGVRVSSSGPSSLRHRRSFDGVGPSVGVRLSPPTDIVQGSSEDQNLHLSDHSYCFSLGPAVVLPGSAGVVSSSSVQASSVARPAQPAVDRCPSPAAGDAPASRLASEHRALAARGFSEEAANRIAAPKAKFTLAIYEGKWKVFASWCQERGLDPLQASSPVIADFLLHLFKDLKRRPSTIAGYRTAIAGALRVSQGVDHGKDERLSALMLSFFREQPRPEHSYPAWDLSLVLKFLLKAPFEPMQMADMKYVTWKTTFLVLLATGSRRGEVHALDYSKVRPDQNWTSVVLEPHASFVGKTELRKSGASVLSPVRIPALGPLVGPGHEEDRGLCPVRALKIYLNRTKDLRGDKKLLLVSYKAGHKGDIHKNTVSSWIRKLLVFCYSKAPEDVIQMSSSRTHEVRALASSMAFRGSIELEEVLRACTWKNANTFTTHYLRDVSVFADSLHSLGPVVAAQNVVLPSGNV